MNLDQQTLKAPKLGNFLTKRSGEVSSQNQPELPQCGSELCSAPQQWQKKASAADRTAIISLRGHEEQTNTAPASHCSRAAKQKAHERRAVAERNPAEAAVARNVLLQLTGRPDANCHLP